MSLAAKVALRQLWKFRSTNAVIVATLAVTTGALLAILAIADNLLVHPWTYDTQRLGVLQHVTAASGQLNYSFSAQEYREIEASGLFEAVNAGMGASAVLLDKDGLARQIRMVRTLPQGLVVTGAAPALGRFVQDSDTGTANPGVVISHDLWRSSFDSRRDAIGETLNINGTALEVIGVMPERFHYLGGDVWSALPTRISTETSADRRYVVNVLLKQGDSIASVLPQLATLAQRISAQGPVERYPPGWTVVGDLIIDAVMGPMRPALLLVVGATALMLLIGLANVVTLLVSRHVASEAESTLRTALGAPLSSLVVLAFVQNLFVVSLGVAAGWSVGGWMFRFLIGLISSDWVPRELEGHFRYADGSLAWVPLLAIGITSALTLAQVLRLRRLDPSRVIREGVRTGERRGQRQMRRLLVGFQVMSAAFVSLLAVSVGVGAWKLGQQSPGFDPDHVLTTRLVLPETSGDASSLRTTFLQQLVESVSRHAIVESAVAIDAAPFQRGVRSATVSGGPIGPDHALPVDYHATHGDFTRVLRPHLVEGRLLGPGDRADTQPVVVVTEALAILLDRSGPVLGRTITVRGQAGEGVQRTVVGVIADVRHDNPLAEARPGVYVPYAQDAATSDGAPPRSMDLLVRLRPGARVPDGFLQRAVAAVDPMVPTLGVATLVDRGQASMAGVTLARELFTMFSIIAVVLAVLGCHVMLSLSLQLRRRELAIRSALGASPARLFALVMREGIVTSAVASALGVVLGWICSRLVNAALQDIASVTLVSSLGVFAGLVVIGALASVLVARDAANAQPQAVLRST